ncbi:carbohydrate ABC transporter permease [Lusitaniella coriacea]|nr:sugar ABC transporter permease [Lusitaniella coriacea]
MLGNSLKRMGKYLAQNPTPYLFLLPALIVLGLTVFFPALQAFFFSFTNYDLIQPPQWIGFANFQRLLKDPVFWQTVRNTLLYLLVVVPLLVVLPLGLAILVNQKLRGMQWFRMAFYVPVVISMVVVGITWKALYASNGLFNQFFKALPGEEVVLQFILPPFAHWLEQTFPGWSETGFPWLTSPYLALWSVMLVTVWKGLGYYMVIYLAGLQSIPQELYEAASIDGSDGWRKHYDITIPLMRSYILLVTVIAAISATKVFEEVFIMTKGGPLNSSKTVVYYVYEQAFVSLEISYGCAIGLVLFSIILGLSIVNLSFLKKQGWQGGFHN